MSDTQEQKQVARHPYHWTVVGLVLVVGVLLRVVGFPHVPPGLNQDEASAGYEAYSLLLTGRDRWGNAWPAYFPGWGSGQNVLYSYLSIPFIKLLGLTPLGIRAVGLLFGVLFLPLTYVATRKTYGERTALCATALIAVLPWPVMASRWALESNLLPFFLLLGVYAVMSAAGRPRLAPLAFLPWAIGLYAYGIGALVIPFLAILMLARYRIAVARNLRGWAMGALLALLVAAPFLAFLAKNNLHLGGPGNSSVLGLTVPRLPASRLSQTRSPLPRRLLGNGHLVVKGFDDGLIWNVARARPISLAVLPFALFAWVRPWRRLRRDPFFLWLVSTVAIFLVTDLNLNRANAVLFPIVALAAAGFIAFAGRLAPAARRPFVIASASALGLATFAFASYYLGTYRRDAAHAFNEGLDEALAQAHRVARPGEPILLSSGIAIPYAYVLVDDRVDPERFQRSKAFFVDKDGTYVVPQVDGVYSDYARLPREARSIVFVGRPGERPGFPVLTEESGWTIRRIQH